MDGYTKIIEEARAGNADLLRRIREMRDRHAADRLRESAGGQRVQLLELDGIPLVDGAASGSFEMPAEAPDDGGLIDLREFGLSTAEGYDHAKVSAEFSAMRESERKADDDSAGLLVLEGVPLRESSYGTGDDETYFEGPDTLPALQDLFTCLPETLANGSPNLESEIVKRCIEDVQRGHQLPPSDIGKLKELLVKHQAEVKALRASKDKEGQDYGSVPDPAEGRVVTDADRAAGLLELDGIPLKAAA